MMLLCVSESVRCDYILVIASCCYYCYDTHTHTDTQADRQTITIIMVNIWQADVYHQLDG